MVPLEDWGSFNSTNGRAEWKQRNCDNLVGGENKHHCSGDYFVKDKNLIISSMNQKKLTWDILIKYHYM